MSDLVSEIIIIDNDVKSRPDIKFGTKVRVLEQEKNIYVNPAWNLGVKESSEDIVCLASDDITVNAKKYFPHFVENLKLFNCLGIARESFAGKAKEGQVLYKEGADIGGGWGTMIMVRKQVWEDIPSNLKIWFGDNWIAYKAKTTASMLLPISTDMSTTSGAKELSDVIKKDISEWKSVVKEIQSKNK